MNTSENINELATALAAAQGELEDAEKNKTGYGYNYADLAQVLGIIRPVFSKHGLSVIQLPHNKDGGIAVTTRLCHQSGQWLEDTLVMPAEKPKNLSLAQGIGVIITYSRRYMLTALAGITQEDPDAAKKGETEVVNMPGAELSEAQQFLSEGMRACATLSELGEFWKDLSADNRAALENVKDEMKKALA